MADIQYKTTVPWDTTLTSVGFLASTISVPSAVRGLASEAVKTTTGAPSTNAGYFIPGAEIQNSVDGTIYRNSGTTAAPVWSLIDSGPYQVNFSGQLSGQTTATRVYSVTGVISTDTPIASISASTNAVSIQKVTAGSGTITVLFSGDPGAGTLVNYLIARATS